jgi:hypothetical protein
MALVVPTVLEDLAVGARVPVVSGVEHLAVLVAQAEALATVFNPFVEKKCHICLQIQKN